MSVLDLPLDAGQQMLDDSLARYLVDDPFPDFTRLSETLGLAGVTAPEASGGFGGDAVEIAIVMARLGPALAGADWLPHAVSTLVLSRFEAVDDLATGKQRAALICSATTASTPNVAVHGNAVTIHGGATLVAGAADAHALLLASESALLLLKADQDGLTLQPQAMRDGTVTANLSFSGTVPCAPLATGEIAQAFSEYARDVVLMGRCAEAVGLIRRMLDDTATFMGERRQFGSPIGRFQTLRHRIVDMQLAAMKAAVLTESAVLAVQHDNPDRVRAVSAACAEVHDAVRIVGEGAVQIHGAMGLTEELSLGRYFRRALSITAAMGSQSEQIRRFAAA